MTTVGVGGGGKSTAVAQAVTYARRKGWVVLYIPQGGLLSCCGAGLVALSCFGPAVLLWSGVRLGRGELLHVYLSPCFV